MRKRLRELSVTTLFVEPGRPWENGYVQSFNGSLQDELVNVAISDRLREAQVVERWRKHRNTVRPHSSLRYRPTAPEARRPRAPCVAPRSPPPRAG